jgi:hypothetical protein
VEVDVGVLTDEVLVDVHGSSIRRHEPLSAALAFRVDEPLLEAGFTVDLPKKVIQLYSHPGDTIADVFGGYSMTLYAARILNEEVHPDEPDWTGYAWENFASETAEQEDYRERIDQLVTGSLARFRGGFFGSS